MRVYTVYTPPCVVLLSGILQRVYGHGALDPSLLLIAVQTTPGNGLFIYMYIVHCMKIYIIGEQSEPSYLVV